MRRYTLLLTALLAACTPATVPSGTTATAALPIEGTHVTIDAVLDGDSVRVDQDGTSIEVRLLGINAPERGECWADEAREALSAALEDGGISLVGDETDQYGRLLGYLHSDTSNINRYLVINGHAIAIAVAHEDRTRAGIVEPDCMRIVGRPFRRSDLGNRTGRPRSRRPEPERRVRGSDQ